MNASNESITVPETFWSPGASSQELGTLAIPSGEVAVCDAGTLDGKVRVAVAPGMYEVRVHRDEQGNNVAAALVMPGAKPVAFEQVGRYGVDAGLSGFFDAKLHETASNFDFDCSIYDDLISEHLEPAEDKGAAGVLIPFEGGAFSACRSGFGDGVYPVLVGRDASERVVAVVTTF